MDSSRFRRDELETILSFSNADGTWAAFTSVPRHATRFIKQGWTLKATAENCRGVTDSWWFTAPERGISICKPVRKLPDLSDEQRAELSERLRINKEAGNADRETFDDPDE